MPKPSVRHAKYYAGRGVESNNIYIGKHHLNRIYSKVKRPKLDFLDSIKTRTSKSDPQTKNWFQLRIARSSSSILLRTLWLLRWTHTQVAQWQGHAAVVQPGWGIYLQWNMLGSQECRNFRFVSFVCLPGTPYICCSRWTTGAGLAWSAKRPWKYKQTSAIRRIISPCVGLWLTCVFQNLEHSPSWIVNTIHYTISNELVKSETFSRSYPCVTVSLC